MLFNDQFDASGLGGLFSEEDMFNINRNAGLQTALGLLAASGPSASPTNFGQVLSQGLQQGDDARQTGMRNTLQTRQLQQQAAQQAQRKNVLSMLGGNNGMNPQQALASGGGPTPENAAKMQPVKPSRERYMMAFNEALGIGDIELAKVIKQNMDSMFPQFKTQSVQELMIDGQPKKFAVGEDGSMQELGVAPEKLIQVDAGGQKYLVSENTGRKISEFNVTMDPFQKAQTNIDYANLDVRRQELANSQSPQAKTPMGYRYKPDGSLEIIPGGPADEKSTMAGQRDAMRSEMVAASAQNVLETISEAKAMVGPTTAGFGSALTGVPTSEARDLKAKLETIKANLGFDRLQQMRESSPTGGALGAVAVQELVALQSTVANLDQAQSTGQLRKNLEKIERHYGNWLKTVKGKVPAEFDRSPRQPGVTPASQSVQSLIDLYAPR